MKRLSILMLFILNLNAFASLGYVANYGSDTVSLFDINTKTELQQIPVGTQPHGTWISNNGKFLYVANMGSNNISVIDIKTNTKITDVTVGNTPVELLSSNGYIYTADSQSNTVSIIGVFTFPLKSLTVKSGLFLRSCILLLKLVVPTTAPFGRSFNFLYL